MKVTASDGNGGSVSDTFDIVVDLPPSADTRITATSDGAHGPFIHSQDRFVKRP